MSYRVIREIKIKPAKDSDDAQNNTVVATANSKKMQSDRRELL